ncbi:MAG: hypothetical protein Kow0099_28440 [Candidatus Abyssubacteria bacterium]
MSATSRSGVAILAALGVLAILGILASAFLAFMRLEQAFAMRDAHQLKAHYLAVAGVQNAIALLEADDPDIDALTDSWWLGNAPDPMPMGEGGYTLTISDESARLNVISAPPQALSAMLGGDKEAVASLVNFRSAFTPFSVEDFVGANLGAEAYSRLIALGTVHGDGRVNVNTANADVLAALPGMDNETAQRIVDFRNGPDGIEGTNDDFVFAAPSDLAKTPGITPVRLAPALTMMKVNSDIFRVHAVGSVHARTDRPEHVRVVANKKISALLQRGDNTTIMITLWESS